MCSDDLGKGTSAGAAQAMARTIAEQAGRAAGRAAVAYGLATMNRLLNEPAPRQREVEGGPWSRVVGVTKVASALEAGKVTLILGSAEVSLQDRAAFMSEMHAIAERRRDLRNILFVKEAARLKFGDIASMVVGGGVDLVLIEDLAHQLLGLPRAGQGTFRWLHENQDMLKRLARMAEEHRVAMLVFADWNSDRTIHGDPLSLREGKVPTSLSDFATHTFYLYQDHSAAGQTAEILGVSRQLPASPEEDVRRVLTMAAQLDLDIVDIARIWVDLTEAGPHYIGLCPFHPEKSPSFAVKRESQVYYCYGCHVGGDLRDFLFRIYRAGKARDR